MKICNKCRSSKPHSEFSKDKSKKDGLQNRCKGCQRNYSTVHYINNKSLYRDNQRANRAIRKNLVAEYLKTHPCVDCGESDIIVLEFDHVRGEKLKDISSLAHAAVSLEVILAEINKCEVRCANCHRKVTAKRASQFRYELVND